MPHARLWRRVQWARVADEDETEAPAEGASVVGRAGTIPLRVAYCTVSVITMFWWTVQMMV